MSEEKAARPVVQDSRDEELRRKLHLLAQLKELREEIKRQSVVVNLIKGQKINSVGMTNLVNMMSVKSAVDQTDGIIRDLHTTASTQSNPADKTTEKSSFGAWRLLSVDVDSIPSGCSKEDKIDVLVTDQTATNPTTSETLVAEDRLKPIVQVGGSLNPVTLINMLLNGGQNVTSVSKNAIDFIVNWVLNSIGSDDFGKAMNVMQAFRQKSVEKNNPGLYNAFLVKLKDRIIPLGKKTFWELIVQGNLGLITSDEVVLSPYDSEAASKFLIIPETVWAEPDEEQIMVEEDVAEKSYFDNSSLLRHYEEPITAGCSKVLCAVDSGEARGEDERDADESTKGQPVQIISFEDGRLYLHEDDLRDILIEYDVHDLPVVVVSIAGKKRLGKSLMLSNFVRFMDHQGRADWLSDAHGPLEGFVWKGGSTGVTTGVFIWSELFVVELPSTKKVAVMLMDTQGSFDTRGDVKESAVVFALSTMISSMQIYNIKGQLAGDDLLHLQMFTEYGKLAQKLDQQGNNAFQSLQILIRDWVYKAEAAFGFEGGMKHLKKVLEVDCQVKKETQDLVRDILYSYNSIECFLMPEPKSCVRNGSFDGTPSEMGAAFTEQLQKFVPHILSPCKLVVKQQAGREIKTRQLLYLFASLYKTFSEDKLPGPQSMCQANVLTLNLIAVDEALLAYRELAVTEFTNHKGAFHDAHLKELLEKFERAAVAKFTQTPKMGGADAEITFTKHLHEKINECVASIYEENSRRLEEERIINEAAENHRRHIEELIERNKQETRALQREREAELEQIGAMKMKSRIYGQMAVEQCHTSRDGGGGGSNRDEMAMRRFEEKAAAARAEADRRFREMQQEQEEKMKILLESSRMTFENYAGLVEASSKRRQAPTSCIIS